MAFRTSLISAGKVINNTLIKSPNIRGMVVLSTPQCTKKIYDSDEKTHTGQTFDEDDYRRVRFINKQKHVNRMYAIDLIAEVPPEPKEARVVWCDGGEGPIGHPRVYINLDQPGNHTCGYCGLRFYKDDHHH